MSGALLRKGGVLNRESPRLSGSSSAITALLYYYRSVEPPAAITVARSRRPIILSQFAGCDV